MVATSAIRDARNQQAFLAWVHSATGWKVEIISGLEEGRLIHLGVVSHEPAARGRCLLVDLGGGSCEVTFSEHSAIRHIVSLPLGAVRLTREFLRHDPPTAEEITRMQGWIWENCYERNSKSDANGSVFCYLWNSGSIGGCRTSCDQIQL